MGTTKSIKAIKKKEKIKEKQKYKENKKELYKKIDGIVTTINELIDIMLEEYEDCHISSSDSVTLRTDGIFFSNLDDLTYKLYKDTSEANSIKIRMRIDIYQYANGLKSFGNLKTKIDNTKYEIVHLDSDISLFSFGEYKLKFKVKRHKHKIKFMTIDVSDENTMIRLY